MSAMGNCSDSSMVDTFFKTLKAELVWPTVFQTRGEAKGAIARYIDGFNNPVRRHSALNFISPAQFERLAAADQPLSTLRSKSTHPRARLRGRPPLSSLRVDRAVRRRAIHMHPNPGP
jgi:putative transposase